MKASVWAAAIVSGRYSNTRIYIVGITYLSEAGARAAAEDLIQKIQALIARGDASGTNDSEWAAGEEIDRLLGEEPHACVYSSYADRRDWRVETAEFQLEDPFLPTPTRTPWRLR